MSRLLLIPIHLDALVLSEDRMVVEAMADFSLLPYCERTSDVNPDVANLSEEILSTPFQNQTLLLKRGIHLHWALPDALTRASHNNDEQEFPPVPNRWLIRRTGTEVKQWLVESDYLYPVGAGSEFGSVTVHYQPQADGQPFRFMGRTKEVSAEWPLTDANDLWPLTDTAPEYYPKLTALGYGEPTFAAFYPNCHSVFGFYDGEYSGDHPGELQYELIGWYGGGANDYLATFVERFKSKYERGKEPTTRELLAGLEREFGWTFGGEDLINCYDAEDRDDVRKKYRENKTLSGSAFMALIEKNLPVPVQGFPSELACYASLNFKAKNPEPNNSSTTIAVGNTGTEALSALLAARIDPSAKNLIEDQLEALQFSSKLQHRQLDVGPKFCEARHEKGFTALAGGSLWAIRPKAETGLAADAADAQTEITLPPEIAHLINDLNEQQQCHDQALEEIESLRRQLFSDWYKYMLCAYPPDDARDDYPDIDEVKSYVEFKVDSLNKVVADAKCRANDLAAAIENLRLELSLVRDGDFLDGMGLLKKFKGQDGKLKGQDDLSKFLRSKFDGASRLVALFNRDPQDNSELLTALGQELNRFIQGPSLYEQTRFQEISLSAKTRELAATQNLQGADVVCLNRGLLEEAYPKEIAKSLVLKKVSGPRYWRPTEPVVLMSGPAMKASLKHGQDGRLREDGLLEAQILEDTVIANPTVESLARIRERIETIRKERPEHFAFTPWTGAAGDPLLFEWEVEVFPLDNLSNLDPVTGNYDRKFISDNYSVPENAVDLSLRRDKGATTKAANLYRGRSILTPHAGIQLRNQIEAFLNKEVLAQYYLHQKIPLEQQSGDYLGKNLESIQVWYKQAFSLTNSEAEAKDSIYNAIRALKELEGLDCLSQALGGFNEALLMHKQTMQLSITDPLGFDDYQSFATDVRDAVKDSIHSAPEPLNDFNPIRSGAMSILRLRLIDTFGQIKDLDLENLDSREIITSDPMTNTAKELRAQCPVWLAPRLVQSARINLRWLSAGHDQVEMNDHPATTPICGWLLTNNLDNSLMIYDGEGKALGSIVSRETHVPDEKWEPSPGSDTRINNISNPHLKKMVEWVCRLDAKEPFLTHFISAIDNALENIEPENFAQHQDLALLMGRPIALVRASVNLELQGRPAINQGWNVFRQQLERESRDDDGFADVAFPIRIGEYRQFNDGLVGYWKERGDEYEDELFHAPQSDEKNGITDIRIKTHRTDTDDEMTVFQSVKSPPQYLSMLLDPRGVVHATSGVVPAKVVAIPPDQYVDALQAIEITFLTAPILTDAGKIHLPLPAEAGYQWSWLQKQDKVWSEVSARGVIEKRVFDRKFEQQSDIIWRELSDKKWIKEIDSTKATVTAKDQRVTTSLANLEEQIPDIEDLLDRAHIGPVDQSARFSGQQEIREGWLKLSADRPNGKSTNGSNSGGPASPGPKS